MDYTNNSKDELLHKLQELEQALKALEISHEYEKKNHEKLDFMLRGRLKELNCHYQISQIMGNENSSVDEVIEKIALTIREGWQFPEIAVVLIDVEGKIYKSERFEISEWTHAKDIVVSENKIGIIQVGYLKSELFDPENPFLPEENNLLSAIAERLSHFLERKRINLSLLSSEVKYRNLIENISDVVFEIDLNGIIIYISPTIEKLLGYTQRDVIGKSFLHFVGENAEYLAERFKVLRDKGVIDNEYKIVSKNGEVHWLRFSTKAIFEDGVFKGGTGTLVDITENMLSRIALQESEALYLSILHASPDVITITDMEGNIKFSSPKVIKMFGLRNHGDANGHSLFEFVAPKDHERAMRNIEKMFHGEFFGAEDYTGVRADGSNFDIEVNGEFIKDAEGQPTGLIFITRDITERKITEERLKKSEETFRYLVETVNDAIYEIDNSGIIKYVSPAIEKIVGYSPDELIGKNFFGYMYPDDRPILMEALSNLADRDSSFLEYRYITKEGKVRWVRSSTSANIRNGVLIGGTGSLTDINDRKLAEDELRKLSRAVEQSPVSIVITNVDGDIEYANPKASETTGYSLEELKGNNPRVLKSGETSSIEYCDLWNSISSGSQWKGLFHNKRKNGELYWESSVITPILDKQGAITHYLAIKEDITEGRKKDEALKLSEKRFSQLAEQSQTIVWEIDDSGLYTYVSEMSTTVWGYTPEEMIGIMHFYDLHPSEDRETYKMKTFAAFARKEQFKNLTNCVITKDGRFIWVSTNGLPVLDDAGNLIGYRGTDNDITEKKQKDIELKRLSLAVEQSPATIVITDLNANVEYVNPAFEATTGYSFAEVVGQSTKILQSGKTDNSVYQQMWETITRGEEWHGEWINKKKNGEFFWENILITPIHDENNVITNYLAVKQDITNRKQAENEIRDLNANLELKIKERTIQLAETNNSLLQEIEERKKKEVDLQVARIEADKANLAKSEFLSRMSHELRTPMNSILGFAQLLEMSDLNNGQRKGVNHIMKSGKHLLDLINEVLDISRIESGRLSLSIEPVQLNGIIQEAIDIVRIQASERQISIEVVNTSDTNSYVKSDRQRLKQVLLNLMNNAIKYNKEGGSVVIKSEIKPKSEGESDMIRISVIDSGIGLASEDIPKLFVPFERVGAEKTATEGTGLGLAVVKKLIGAMGGKLGVDSILGVGSTFWIELPQSESHQDKLKKSGILDALESIISEKTGTILYVEDNVSNIELVEQILTSQRANIRLVTSTLGRRTLDLAVANNPDLILLDLNLPDIHGSEVINLLMNDERTKSIPVVIISADAMPHQLDRLLHAGAKKYLTKPLDVSDFLKIIDEYIK